jgi:putative ABC transport system ATP-binding protein
VPANSRTCKIPVQLTGATKRFRQGESIIEAIKDVDLTIGEGEFVSVMGASGSGKSTLLHVLAGLAKLDEGSVLIDGVDLSSLTDAQLTRFRRRKIGLVFQAFNLIASLTAFDNIVLPALTEGRDTQREGQVAGLIDRLGLAARRRHRPDALSGGEQQRVAIARALVNDPALVLADEPTGSLDSVSGQGICRLLRELCNEQRRTIIIVTHEPAVAVWAQRAIVMKDGRILTELGGGDLKDAQTLAARYQEAVGTGCLSDAPLLASTSPNERAG